MKVLELKGYKSIRAFNAFQALMLGLNMLPAYIGEKYEKFFSKIGLMDEVSQEKLIREAAFFVELKQDEVEAMISFCADANGVPYSAENLKNLGPREIIECIVSVSMAIARMNIGIISDTEKKNLKDSA